MKKKRLFLLALIFFLCMGIWILVRSYNQKQEASAENVQKEEDVLWELSTDAVTSITYKKGGFSYTFEKTDEKWIYAGDKNLPVDEEKIENILADFEKVTAVRTLMDVEDCSEYGLDQPYLTIHLQDMDGKEYILHVGDMNGTTGDYYACMEEEHTVYTIDSVIPMDFEIRLYDLAKTESFPSIDSSEVTAVEVQSESGIFKAYLDKSSTTAWLISDGINVYEGDESLLGTLTDGLGGWTYESCMEYDGQNLETYGLHEPQAILAVDYEENAEEKQEVWLIGDKSEDGCYYVQRQGSTEVHTLLASSLEPFLTADIENYRSLVLSNRTMDETKELALEYNGKTYTFIQTKNEEENEDGETVTSYYCTRNGKEFDTESYQTFFKTARGMTAERYLKEEECQELSDMLEKGAKCKVTFYTENRNVYTAAYYSYNDNFYLAEVDDDSYALVNKMDAETLLEGAEKVIK